MSITIDPNGHPRPELYTLAHRALPGIAFAQPFAILSAAAAGSGDRGEFYSPIFDQIRTVDPSLVMGPYLPECSLELIQIRGCPGIIFKLPTPKFPTEAYIAGFFAEVALHDVVPELSADMCRFFTLECGWNFITETPCSMFCEWTQKNDHLNYGEQPMWNGDPNSFLALIDQAIGTKSEASPR